MSVIPRNERYAFADPNHDPMVQFPTVVRELHCAYKEYDFVWDRQKERWLCIKWLSYPMKTKLAPIYFVEGRRGIYRVPDSAFIEWLKKTDIARCASSIEAFLDDLDRRYDAHVEKTLADSKAAGDDITKPWLDYVRKNSSTTSSIAGWRKRHLVNIRDAAQGSLGGAAILEGPQEAA